MDVCHGLRRWLAELQWLQAGRPGTCGYALLIPLANFIWSWSQNGSRWYGQACSAVTLQVGQSTWVELLPVILGEGDAYRHLQLWNIVLDPRELPRFPHHLLYTLFCLLCRSCSFSPQLFLKRNSCMYRWIFQCAHGRRRVQWPPVPRHFRPLPFSISCLILLKFFFDLSCLPFQFYLLPPFVPFPHYLQFARYAVLYFASVIKF